MGKGPLLTKEGDPSKGVGLGLCLRKGGRVDGAPGELGLFPAQEKRLRRREGDANIRREHPVRAAAVIIIIAIIIISIIFSIISFFVSLT